MKISLAEIVELQPIYEIIKGKILPVRTSYKFSKLFKAIEKEYEFYQTQMALLIHEYSEKDKDGNTVPGNDGIKIQADRLEECQTKIDELVGLEVEVPEVSFEFDEIEKLELTVAQLMKMSMFINEEKQA